MCAFVLSYFSSGAIVNCHWQTSPFLYRVYLLRRTGSKAGIKGEVEQSAYLVFFYPINSYTETFICRDSCFKLGFVSGCMSGMITGAFGLLEYIFEGDV